MQNPNIEAVLMVAVASGDASCPCGYAAQLLYLKTGARLEIRGAGKFDDMGAAAATAVKLVLAELKRPLQIRLITNADTGWLNKIDTGESVLHPIDDPENLANVALFNVLRVVAHTRLLALALSGVETAPEIIRYAKSSVN